jgi:hypothetical protein
MGAACWPWGLFQHPSPFSLSTYTSQMIIPGLWPNSLWAFYWGQSTASLELLAVQQRGISRVRGSRGTVLGRMSWLQISLAPSLPVQSTSGTNLPSLKFNLSLLLF